MRPNRLDPTLRRYILGGLKDRHQLEEVEEQIMTDPDALDALGAMEDELSEAYVDEALPDADRRAFERNFLTTGDRRRRLRFVRLLQGYAAAASGSAPERTATAVRPTPAGRWIPPVWMAAAAAVVALLVAGNIWFAFRGSRIQAELDRVLAQQRLARQDETRLQGQVSRLATEVGQLQTRLEQSQQDRLTPRDAATPATTFVLSAPLVRSDGSLNRIVVPAGAEVIRLRLELPGQDYRTYRAVLYDAEAEELWSQSKLTAESRGGRRSITVVVPSQVLPRGDYQLQLSGAAERGAQEVIATYGLRVIRGTTP
jgi:hypothetical protein